MNAEHLDTVAAMLLGLLLAASVVVPAVYAAARIRRPSAARRERVGTATYAVTTLAVLGLVVGGLPIPFFLVLVAVNIVFGRRENVPISRFPMFSRPAIVQWYIRVEDQDGTPLSGPAYFGMPTSLIMKRFNTEMKSADPETSIHRASHQQRVEAAERLADFMVGMLKRKRRAATLITTVRLLYIEVAQQENRLVVTPELLTERAV
jgi:hypothetical protein